MLLSFKRSLFIHNVENDLQACRSAHKFIDIINE
jgi:hypothetical protein